MSQKGSGFALKFISGMYQGGELPLKDDTVVVIGRSSELDMVLVEDMVSRKHAKITVSGGSIVIEDLGSTNGTFVNGEKIKSHKLKESDRILVGTSILKVVRQGAGSVDLDEASVKAKLNQVASAQASKQTRTAMTGKLEEIPFTDLVQLFQTSKKDGVFRVENGRVAKIYLRQGRVYYACIDDNHDLGPAKSFNRIMQWKEGDFELLPPDKESFLTELDSSTEALLMEAMRLEDEWVRIAPKLPALDAALSVSMPLTAPLRDLSADELDLVQLVHNYGTLQGVIDHSPKDDAVAAEAVLTLIEREYLRAG